MSAPSWTSDRLSAVAAPAGKASDLTVSTRGRVCCSRLTQNVIPLRSRVGRGLRTRRTLRSARRGSAHGRQAVGALPHAPIALLEQPRTTPVLSACRRAHAACPARRPTAQQDARVPCPKTEVHGQRDAGGIAGQFVVFTPRRRKTKRRRASSTRRRACFFVVA
jgi:hypothetical protein